MGGMLSAKCYGHRQARGQRPSVAKNKGLLVTDRRVWLGHTSGRTQGGQLGKYVEHRAVLAREVRAERGLVPWKREVQRELADQSRLCRTEAHGEFPAKEGPAMHGEQGAGRVGSKEQDK